jgi:hypothetical protein
MLFKKTRNNKNREGSTLLRFWEVGNTVNSFVVTRSRKILLFFGVILSLVFFQQRGLFDVSRTRSGLHLQFDWTNLERMSPLARNMSRHQEELCDLSLANFRYDLRHGMGSDLHMWSQALCNGMEQGLRIRSPMPWNWRDEASCHNLSIAAKNRDRSDFINSSAMTCYFPQSELMCPNDVQRAVLDDQIVGTIPIEMAPRFTIVGRECPTLIEKYGVSEIRAAAMEFLFTRVSPIVQEEAQRQLPIVFGELRQVPTNLITVNIRWGDKGEEMQLVSIDKYINAVKEILNMRQMDKSISESEKAKTVSIFLATEDPEAVKQFTEAAPTDWKIYLDAYYQELLPHRLSEFNGNPLMTAKLNGRPGLITLGSLLVSMESKDFVLTTASNWSRLINELRKNVLNPRCNNCTRMIDLLDDEWR